MSSEALFAELEGIVRRLRKDCPWDREQTHKSLRPSLIEETYEVVESIEENDLPALKGELGDLLLHILLQAVIAEEEQAFTLPEVICWENKNRSTKYEFLKNVLNKKSEY